LKNDGLLNRWEESTSGPPRKYYGLTEIGQTFLKELSGTWTELSDAVNLITNQNNSHEQNCKYKSRRNDFHIDEDAYQKLTRYFDAIKRSLSNSSGHDEI
jgi:DNA-binding PadR family transcriptional regulator